MKFVENPDAITSLNNQYYKRFRIAFTPTPKIDGAEWSNLHCHIPAEFGSEPGPYNYKRAPYQSEWLTKLTDNHTRKIVLMCAARTGKTQVIRNSICYFMANDPCPIMVMLPTLGKAEEFSQNEIDPMIRVTPIVRDLVGDRRLRDSGNKKFIKKFPGGSLRFVGAESDTGLHGVTIRVLFADETSRYEQSISDSGNPLYLASIRTTTYRHRGKLVYTSTPKNKGECHIEKEFLQSDQRYYFVPCPHCGTYQKLEWKSLNFTEDKDNPTYICEKSCEISEDEKFLMVQKGEWRVTNPDSKTVGYHLNSMYSPYISWAEMVKEWYEAQGDREKLRIFINSRLAETFDDSLQTVSVHALSQRLENFNAHMPTQTEFENGAGLITCGIDVQENRIEAYVYAWGVDDERWLIDYRVFAGEVATDKTPWNDLTKFLLHSSYKTTYDVPIRIQAFAIDIGYQVGTVFNWYLDFLKVNTNGIKPFLIAGDTDGNDIKHIQMRQHPTYHVPYILLGSNVSKQVFMTALSNTKPGPQYIHLPRQLPPLDGFDRFLESEVLEQLTAEKQTTKYVKGQPVRYWRNTRKRNEAFDCGRYAYAALLAQGANYTDQIGELVRMVSEARPSTNDIQTQETSTQNLATPIRQTIRVVNKGGFRW